MRSTPKIVLGVIAAVAICLAATIAWFSYHKPMACQTDESLIDRSNPPYSVVRTDTACDGIASSYDVALELLGPLERRSRIFEYGDGTSFVRSGDESKPVIRWIDGRTLEVDIGTVAYVRSAIDHAGDITIKYKINKIMFKS